jgi:hypothetical protein
MDTEDFSPDNRGRANLPEFFSVPSQEVSFRGQQGCSIFLDGVIDHYCLERAEKTEHIIRDRLLSFSFVRQDSSNRALQVASGGPSTDRAISVFSPELEQVLRVSTPYIMGVVQPGRNPTRCYCRDNEKLAPAALQPFQLQPWNIALAGAGAYSCRRRTRLGIDPEHTRQTRGNLTT